MKVTITHKTCKQVSPDDWDTFTKVVHISEDETIKEIKEKHFKEWPTVDVELHIESVKA